MKLQGLARIHKIAWGTVLLAFLSVMFLSLFNPVDAGPSHKMNDTSGCPFMSHEEVICSMSTLDHLAAWKTAFTATLSSLTLLLLVVATAALVPAVAPHLLLKYSYKIKLLNRDVRERIYQFSYRPWQELFSRGLLHPKVF